ANFQLAKLYYRQQKYLKAEKAFEDVDVYDLNTEELSEYYFKSGYSFFMLKKYDKAKKHLFEIIDIDTKYFASANYYYAHILYSEKNYETALKSFLKIEKDETFKHVIPYYIAQIYYLQGKYDEVIAYAPPLLDSATASRADEIARILGESYFKTEQYAASIPYLEKYMSKTKNIITRQDNYETGYAYYKSGADVTKAISYFEKVTTVEDSLTQNTYYILGDCYLKNGNKNFAMNSFLSASKYSFYPTIKEDALFNYAKLAYELSINPYNEAVEAFQKFINDYPESSKIDEARTSLVNLFLTTKNYKDALTSIEKIKHRDDKLNKAYQKIAYYRGIELFNNKDIDSAITVLNKSNTQPFDNTIKANCYYWKGEGFYRLSEFDSAIVNYKTFLISPGAFSLPIYNTANYNIGYCYFKQKNYKSAINNFRKFYTNKSDENKKVINDACLRIADCYFISKEYSNAIEYYDRAIAIKSFDTDYAMYQKSLCYGVLGKYDSKINTLLVMLEQYPKTAYCDDAEFELANTYLTKNDNENALIYYKKVNTDFSSGSYAKRALLKTGLIYFNTDRDTLALQTFKKVVSDYPATNESKDALISIRNIYMDMDSVSAFYLYVKGQPEYGTKTETEQDSMTYLAAETKYMNGDCDKATRGFSKYIQQFPNGYFVTNAYYYKAECDYKNNNLAEALMGYIYVTGKPQNKFSEYALIKAAEINYKLNRYDSAAFYYSELEKNAEYKSNIILARSAIMRCNWKAGNYNKAIIAARELIGTEKVTEELLTEAHVTIGRSALLLDSTALAQTEFEFAYKLSPTSEFGAEAKYNLAYLQYVLQDYVKSENLIFEVINLVPSYDYWLAKSYILLADVYVKTGNIFQAKYTLQSIIDNYDGADLVTIAHEKLNKINNDEKEKAQLLLLEQQKIQEDEKIKFDNTPDSEKLFEEKE
ncbi:MAG: tetratricopeptide repeat protein, partial [Bacteroidetes bacterium]|nr:tetratricopeptide repeat protein [Bacteroidota bacterium]